MSSLSARSMGCLDSFSADFPWTWKDFVMYSLNRIRVYNTRLCPTRSVQWHHRRLQRIRPVHYRIAYNILRRDYCNTKEKQPEEKKQEEEKSNPYNPLNIVSGVAAWGLNTTADAIEFAATLV